MLFRSALILERLYSLRCHAWGAQTVQTLQDQGQGHDRAKQQGPDGPARGLYDGKQDNLQCRKVAQCCPLWPSVVLTFLVDNFVDNFALTRPKPHEIRLVLNRLDFEQKKSESKQGLA